MKSIFIVTDLEGTAGVVSFADQSYPDGRYYDAAKKLATAEVNAAVEGLLADGRRRDPDLGRARRGRAGFRGVAPGGPVAARPADAALVAAGAHHPPLRGGGDDRPARPGRDRHRQPESHPEQPHRGLLQAERPAHRRDRADRALLRRARPAADLPERRRGRVPRGGGARARHRHGRGEGRGGPWRGDLPLRAGRAGPHPRGDRGRGAPAGRARRSRRSSGRGRMSWKNVSSTPTWPTRPPISPASSAWTARPSVCAGKMSGISSIVDFRGLAR